MATAARSCSRSTCPPRGSRTGNLRPLDGGMGTLRPDATILAARGRANIDGEPIQGPLAQFELLGRQLRTLMLGHRNEWLPGPDSPPTPRRSDVGSRPERTPCASPSLATSSRLRSPNDSSVPTTSPSASDRPTSRHRMRRVRSIDHRSSSAARTSRWDRASSPQERCAGPWAVVEPPGP